VHWETVLAFLKLHPCGQKTGLRGLGFRNNRVRVPIHFANNHFTFEKFPPPPLLLHPNVLDVDKLLSDL